MVLFHGTRMVVKDCPKLLLGACRTFHTQRSLLRSYYEVLGVTKNSTTKEIKAAYVQLCKQFHPDRRPQTSDQKFIELNEAYTTLIKPSTRAAYDSRLTYEDHWTSEPTGHSRRHHSYRGGNFNEHQQYRTEYYWYYEWPKANKRNEGSSSNLDFGPYPNYVVVLGCIGLLFIGAFLHYVSYKASVTFKMDDKTREILASYAEMKKQAMEPGNEKQMDIFFEKYFAARKASKNHQPHIGS